MVFIAISLQTFWQKLFCKYLLSNPPRNVVIMATKMLNFWEKTKINSSEVVWGIKLNICINVVVLHKHFRCYGNLKFP